jgi:hypothetical protein
MNPLWADAILIAFGLIVYTVGCLVFLAQRRHNRRIAASKTWPATDGMITASALDVPDPKQPQVYAAAVRYSYRVDNKDFVSCRVFWASNEGRQKVMAPIVAAYPAGRKVQVRYDPENPAEAVIETETNIGSKSLYYYAIAMMVLGVVALGWGLSAFTVHGLTEMGVTLA